MQMIFAFTFNDETKELTYASNIRPTKKAPMVALKILQRAIIAQAVNEASENGDKSKCEPKT